MEAADISKITYELIRVHADRLQMSWEDDRSKIVRQYIQLQSENHNLKLALKRSVKTENVLRKDIERIAERVFENKSRTTPTQISIKPNIEKLDELIKPVATDEKFLSNKKRFRDQELKERKYIGDLRSRKAREAVPGFVCDQCSKYYLELERQGIINTLNKDEMLLNCSRHKSRWTPPSTPEGFWDISVKTPDDWI